MLKNHHSNHNNKQFCVDRNRTWGVCCVNKIRKISWLNKRSLTTYLFIIINLVNVKAQLIISKNNKTLELSQNGSEISKIDKDTLANFLGKSKDINSGCFFYTYHSQNRYGKWTGNCSEGLLDGQGTMVLYDNDTILYISKCTYLQGYKTGFAIDSSYNFTYTGDYERGARSGKGKVVFKNGFTYDGEWKDGERNGRGECKNEDGSTYDGEWKDGKRNGVGKYVAKDGSTHDGEWKDDIPNGRGKVVYKDGSTYDGEWKDGKRNGVGKYVSNNGYVYNGEWKDGKHELGISYIKNKKVKFYTQNNNNRYGEWSGKKKDGFITGEGIMKTYENDSLIMVSKCTYINGYIEGLSSDSTQTYVFYGDYKNGKRNGKGKIVYTNGDVYEGAWSNNMFDGFGKFVGSNGQSYEGYWKENEKHGKGKMIFKDGNVYHGGWSHDMFDGFGKFTLSDGTGQYEGFWKENKRHGKGKNIYKYGEVYEGDWIENKRHGKGKMIYKAEVYEGDWIENKRHGKGRSNFENGDVYEGDWKEDNINGAGKLSYFSGYEVEGNWENGKLINKIGTKEQLFKSYNKKYITSLIDGGIDCISNRINIYISGNRPSINTSIIYNNVLFFGGEFNRIHGIPTNDNNEGGSIVALHNDSIFGFLESDGTTLIDFGVVYKFKIFKNNLFAATSKGLWKFSNGRWTKALGEKKLCNQDCEVLDIEVFNEKLYCVLSCTRPIGTCFFYTKLMEYTGTGYLDLDSLNLYISIKNKHISLKSGSQYLYIANDSSIFSYDGSVVKRIKHYVPQITLVYSKNKVFGIYDATRRGSEFETKYDKYFEIHGDSVREIQIENELKSSNSRISKISVFNNDIYITTNSLWKLPKGDATYMFKLSGGQLIQTKIINCISCVLLHGWDKPINIYSNEGECDKIEERNNMPLANSDGNKITSNSAENANSSKVGTSYDENRNISKQGDRIKGEFQNEGKSISTNNATSEEDLQLKLKKICHICEGTGIAKRCICSNGYRHCGDCHGTRFLRNGKVCLSCRGSGLAICSLCNGKIKGFKCDHLKWYLIISGL